MKTTPALLTAALILLSPLARAAQSQEEITLKQIYATKSANWDEFTACMHPKAMARFKDLMMPVAEQATAANTPDAKKILERVFGNQDLAKLKAATPPEFFRAFMANWAAKNPGFVEAMKGASVQVIGHLDEGADQSHIVYRLKMEAGGSDIVKLEIASMQKDGEEWRSQLSGELENLAASLLRQLKPR